uniref:Uncharacterized protein n=1 Tax=Coccidioides posadasii RMSCC 3488 TaxID=454284 RepID=A0A0J6FPU8_COCPO|nr:hypothetical protein CPAG_07793 [Coccidioides posadasii RMSCC 3488]
MATTVKVKLSEIDRESDKKKSVDFNYQSTKEKAPANIDFGDLECAWTNISRSHHRNREITHLCERIKPGNTSKERNTVISSSNPTRQPFREFSSRQARSLGGKA